MKKRDILFLTVVVMLALGSNVYAMHISEGFLPPVWCGAYIILCLPFLAVGLKQIRKKTGKNKNLKMLLGLIAAYTFVLSAMKIPSVTGSCSHPTGTGLGAMIFGPYITSVVGLLVLIFQALFLAHGGITTLGANTFSMGVVGPLMSYFIYKMLKNKNKKLAIFLAATLGDLTTYAVTSVQLALAFPSKSGGVLVSFYKFAGIFSLTQIPLAIIEGILTVMIFEFIEKYSSTELKEMNEV